MDEWKYTIKARPTLYKNILFDSRIEARWAAFFDFWPIHFFDWKYHPCDLERWNPDFSVTLFHIDKEEEVCEVNFLIEVKPYDFVEQFANHPAMSIKFPESVDIDGVIFLGNSPSVVEFRMDNKYRWDKMRGNLKELFRMTERDLPKNADDVIRTYWSRAGNKVKYRHA